VMRAPMPEDLLAREGCSLGVQNLRVSMLVIRSNFFSFGLIVDPAGLRFVRVNHCACEFRATSSMIRAFGECLGTERR
jgi:hypothetical protein